MRIHLTKKEKEHLKKTYGVTGPQITEILNDVKHTRAFQQVQSFINLECADKADMLELAMNKDGTITYTIVAKEDESKA